MGRFFFDIPLEGVLDYEEKIHRWHERERRELSFDGYINELSKYLNSLGFYVEVSTGNTWQGLRLIIVGESMGGTRLIAVHPKDERGVIYILEDHGQVPSQLTQYLALRAVTYTRLVEAGAVSVKAMLELNKHDRFAAEMPGESEQVENKPEEGTTTEAYIVRTDRVLH
ncbi:MAG: hypothetical protein A3I29_01800 [Candidatus Magasanikbacteria bacterium RIFCSPLOWO2_02_FULL_44_11]|uniref:Uncharacterized protein n=2 Tax=Candidatus Magasanikiibacteriota TaxID=1752731 RepID=A0A1F6N998_9BACT|nr:MAG: hypothetical protein A3D53_01030 [Candidatus Magasanikbacteria bacterium RIFCSPHIGHO2_02_FULL_45_10]OGH80484.1 MAG: hypothetical protein A3I29_01800 [Candidatus Magasanikbacteria bacterium RIFCSPLOWO2_02_FULL_44_11]